MAVVTSDQVITLNSLNYIRYLSSETAYCKGIPPDNMQKTYSIKIFRGLVFTPENAQGMYMLQVQRNSG